MAESEFMQRLRERVDDLAKPHRELYGDDAPVVRMADRILQAAERLEVELRAARVTTADAHARTGWAMETLQKWARARLDGEDVPAAWADLEVEETPSGYVFVLATIPPNPRASAA